ncbi:haloacid dehalogenase-like hydrolase superfamily protein [Striga asiatica]|uniref:Haloacid dehalogenase-like hydrolase superfamily protein n=1 Tax=Striga asiatica TaxID=4170 RepID=A0A5A7P7G1_STRAF|nr:haloacid dehalogenase-like hydrolase superfamily protein [Striga asiatica]
MQGLSSGEDGDVWITFMYANTNKRERIQQCSWSSRWILGGRGAGMRFVMLVRKVGNLRKNVRRFFFDERWFRRERVREVMQQGWSIEQSDTPMYQVSENIKATRNDLLKKLNSCTLSQRQQQLT